MELLREIGRGSMESEGGAEIRHRPAPAAAIGADQESGSDLNDGLDPNPISTLTPGVSIGLGLAYSAVLGRLNLVLLFSI